MANFILFREVVHQELKNKESYIN